MKAFAHPFPVQTYLARLLAVVAACMMLYGTAAEAANSAAEYGAEQLLSAPTGVHVGDSESAGHHHHDGQKNSEKGEQHGLCAQSHCHHNAFNNGGARFSSNMDEMQNVYFESIGNLLPSAAIDGLKRPPRA